MSMIYLTSTSRDVCAQAFPDFKMQRKTRNGEGLEPRLVADMSILMYTRARVSIARALGSWAGHVRMGPTARPARSSAFPFVVDE